MSFLRYLPDSLKERLRLRAGAVTMRSRLENLRRAGFSPRQIIDAGAYHGEWTQLAHTVFPLAHLLLIEPQPALSVSLNLLCAGLPSARLRPCLLGRTEGEAAFLLQESNSRVVPTDYPAGHGESVVRIPVGTLAQIAREEGFEKCELLKLDLQGHELEALAGAGEIFGKTEVILCEVSWLRIGDVPIVAEVLAAFTARGYRPYDVMGFNYRPLDRALWQTDFLFVLETSPLVTSRQWM